MDFFHVSDDAPRMTMKPDDRNQQHPTGAPFNDNSNAVNPPVPSKRPSARAVAMPQQHQRLHGNDVVQQQQQQPKVFGAENSGAPQPRTRAMANVSTATGSSAVAPTQQQQQQQQQPGSGPISAATASPAPAAAMPTLPFNLLSQVPMLPPHILDTMDDAVKARWFQLVGEMQCILAQVQAQQLVQQQQPSAALAVPQPRSHQQQQQQIHQPSTSASSSWNIDATAFQPPPLPPSAPQPTTSSSSAGVLTETAILAQQWQQFQLEQQQQAGSNAQGANPLIARVQIGRRPGTQPPPPQQQQSFGRTTPGPFDDRGYHTKPRDFQDENGPGIWCLVEFKRQRIKRFDSPFWVTPGEYVIVDGDRGQDCGFVVQCTQRNVDGTVRSETIDNTTIDIHRVKADKESRVYSIADQAQVNLLHGEIASMERFALKVCRDRVGEMNLNMEIVDCEFQFDRKKVTFYFDSQESIDFRELTKDLFRVFGSRIWLENINSKVKNVVPEGALSHADKVMYAERGLRAPRR